MADTPSEAPAEAPKAPESEANPTPTTNPEPAQVPDMHGFTSEQLAEMDKFFKANGGFEKIKSKISNPDKPAETVAEPQKTEPTSQPQSQPVETPRFQRPTGARTLEEINTRRYFKDLSLDPRFAPIAKEIEDGSVLKEMDSLGIVAVNPDYSINEDRLLQFLDLKAKTVPAKPTESEPNASAAPTVSYTEVGENGISTIDQAYKIIMEPGNPNIKAAEDFIKESYNGKK